MATAEASAPTGFLRFGWSPQAFHRLSALVTLIILVVIFAFGNAAFLTVGNGMTVLLQTAVIALLGIGMTRVIITGGIDLSVGSVLALAGTVTGMLVKAGMPVVPASGSGRFVAC